MPLDENITYERREILLDDISRQLTEAGKRYLDRKFPKWMAEGKANEKYKRMDLIARAYVDSRFHWYDLLLHSGGKNNEQTIEWKEGRVEIPKIGYNAGGTYTNYTPEKLLETLEFLYSKINERDFTEVRDEMREEMHPKRLLRIAAKAAIEEDGNGLLEDIQPLLKLMNIKL
ncbi:hypothetical protein A3K73_02520 [Candidatus Pacearchaeota archaeon RBG_13_36_9]|nr:MAG: hypothetical protein A3K73_02520 [Candidatus Pacearchaeota archaeon RBG_13_36_9]HJX50893.1 hypothetical protein [Candidatus Nanoarchaeia archaeon]